MSNRDATGKFEKGTTGNPNGRPKVPEEFKELAQKYSLVALKVVVEILENPKTVTRDRIRAAEIIMDRGLGRPSQVVESLNHNIEVSKDDIDKLKAKYNLS